MTPTLATRFVPPSLRTKGVLLLFVIAVVGVLAAAYRFVFGLGAATHLDQSYPWGIWKAFNVVVGIALSSGGFTTAAYVHIFGRHRYEPFLRPALLAAALGYTFAVLGLAFDLGRYYNLWHPIIPSMWQGNSVLFEVAICVMVYLTIMYLELVPVIAERFRRADCNPKLRTLANAVEARLSPVLSFVIIAGVVVSCLHQSSLGNLLVLAPSKVNPLWYSPALAPLFLLSAIAVGIPMVILVVMGASWSMGKRPDMDRLADFAHIIPLTLGFYLAARFSDFVIREAYVHLPDSWILTSLFIFEILLCGLLPLLLLLNSRFRRSPKWLLTISSLIVLGIIIQRLSVVLIGYQPLYAEHAYVPSIAEFAVTFGLLATAILLFRLGITHLPILGPSAEER